MDWGLIWELIWLLFRFITVSGTVLAASIWFFLIDKPIPSFALLLALHWFVDLLKDEDDERT